MGPLAKGDHRDVGRGLRRSLKQLGGGSLAQGFKEAAQVGAYAARQPRRDSLGMCIA